MPEPPPRGIDKAVVVAKVLVDYGPVCAACILAECGLPTGDIEPTINRIEPTLAVYQNVPCVRRPTDDVN